MSGKTMTVSVILHGLLLVGAVYASVAAPKEVKKEEEKVSFVEIEEQKPEPPKPEEPPPPPPPEQPQEAPPIPKGFQELVPPDEPPPEIPKVDLSAPAVSAADFSGIGIAGGKADGDATVKEAPRVEPPPESQPGFAYEVAVLDSPPRLSNANQVQSTLQRLYPRMLQDAGIEGTVVMQFVITEKGEVEPSSVKVISSTHEQFASASEKAVERFRFRPGKYKGKDVRVLIQMPIAWKPQE